MKKIIKKQLKGDEFVSTLQKLIVFVEKRSRELIVAAVLVAFVLLVFAGVRLVQSRGLKSQSQLLAEMFSLRQQLEDSPESLTRLEKLAGTKKHARVGNILLATYWMDKSDWTQAQSWLDRVKGGPKDFVYYQAQDLLGQTYILQGEYDKALAVLKSIEKEKPKDFLLDVVLFRQAEALEKKGDRDQAAALYKKIQDEFPQSYYGYEAAEKAKKLQGEK